MFQVKDFVQKNLGVIDDEGNQSIAFRMPNCEELITAIDFVNSPLATTSANLSGEKPVNNIKDVDDRIIDQVDFVYEKKLHKGNLTFPSEVISCLGDLPEVIRPNVN